MGRLFLIISAAVATSAGCIDDMFAVQCVDLKPDWPKGYSRLGGALYGKGSPEEAVKAYQKGQ